MKAAALKVRMVKVAKLAPYAGNARLHPDWQVAQIAASIAEFGFCNPILVGGDGVIVAGHGRLLAAERLGMDTVPVIELGHLTPVQQRALVIADNKIAENAGWDEDLLRSELAALQADGFDLDVVGFSDAELDELLAGVEEDALPAELGDPDFVPETPPAPVTRPGDVWVLGSHRVICGDATDAAVVERVCDGPVDACWTDPPYGVACDGAAGRIANDDLPAAEFRAFLRAALGAVAKVMQPGAPIYVAHADLNGLSAKVVRAVQDAGFHVQNCLIWVKPSLVLGSCDYQARHEPILYGWKPGAAHAWFGGRSQTTVLEGGGVQLRVMPDGSVQVDLGDQTVVIRGEGLELEAVEGSVLRFDKPSRSAEHPTMKPVELICRMLENSTRPRAVVLDPFGGSGSTLIACESLGRRARLVELEPRFVDVIVRRWETFTSRSAVREDGVAFADLRPAA